MLKPLCRVARAALVSTQSASARTASARTASSGSRHVSSNVTPALLSSAAAPLAWRGAYVMGSLAALGLTSLLMGPELVAESNSHPPGNSNLIAGPEIARHNTIDSAWVVIAGGVYDVTAFLSKHPAGAEVILTNSGKDITALFNSLHAKGTLQTVLPQLTKVGVLDPLSQIEVMSESEGEDDIQERRDALPPAETVQNLNEFEGLARELLGEESRAWRYFSSYSDDGVAYRSTANSFNSLRFIPRVNIPVKMIDSSTTFLGHSIPLPIFMAPTGQNRNGHPDGERNHVRAACRTGIPQGVSGGSSVSIEEILEERNDLVKTGGRNTMVWWQLYIRSDRKESERMIKEAVEHGANAILITVDVTALGNRESDAPPKSANTNSSKGGLASAGFSLYDADLSWKDIEWVKSIVPGVPVLVKGIGAVEDVLLAKKHGAAGCILSNHGARQLDHSPPPLATLVRLRKEHKEILEDQSEFEVYLDGGIKRGTDVLKALCLGARGVGIGRSIIYAQVILDLLRRGWYRSSD